MIDTIKAINIVKQKLTDKKERYNHSYRVYEMAIRLAKHYNCDIERIGLAAIFHDYAKYDSIEEQKKYIPESEIKLYEETPVMYHALAAAYVLKNEYLVIDKDIINGIKYHVWGRPGMNLFEKIIFISDKIELGRNYPIVEEFRNLAFTNITEACYRFLVDNIDYSLKKGFTIHSSQYETIKSLEEELNERN